jgi:hypothetical protein
MSKPIGRKIAQWCFSLALLIAVAAPLSRPATPPTTLGDCVTVSGHICPD